MSKLPVLNIFTNFSAAVFQRDVIAGAREVFDNCGYQTAIIEVTTTPTSLADLPIERDLAGALIITSVLPDAVIGELHHRKVPISLVSHQMAHIPGVMPNNRQGIAMLMEHLVVAHGRKRPVFIMGYMTQTDGIQRTAAFEQEVMRYNLNVPPAFYLRGDFSPEVAAESMMQFLSFDPDFDAVVASDYLMAEAAMQVIKASGRRVPEDVAIVAFGDGPEAAQAGITTVAADITELGRRAARQLLGQIEGLRIRGLTLLSTELIKRETTANRAKVSTGK